MLTARPDLLRGERFGAMYYARAQTHFIPVQRGPARLLARARDSGALLAWAEDPSLLGPAEPDALRLLADWRTRGLLDAEYRCRAALVSNETIPGALSAPLVTSVELTRACNLDCRHCYVQLVRQPERRELALPVLSRLFASLRAMGAPVVVLTGGEPLTRTDLWEVVEEAARHELDAFLCTNATQIDAERARRLARSPLRGFSISLDGPDAESHEQQRGPGSFARAVRGVRALVEAGARNVKVRVTVTAKNAPRLPAFASLARELGIAQIAFKPFRRLGAASDEDELVIARDAYFAATERARDGWPPDGCPLELDDGMPERPEPWMGLPAFGCVGGTTSATVTADGRVIACGAVLADDDWTLRERSFEECWREAPSLVRWRRIEPSGACSSCAERASCGGGCRARALGRGGGMGQPEPWAPCESRAPRRPE